MKYLLTDPKSDLAETIFKSVKAVNAPTARAADASELAELVGKDDFCVVVKSTGEQMWLRSAKKKLLIEQRLQEIMNYSGIPPHLEGYFLIKEAVKMCCDNPRYIINMKNTLYPKIAALYKSSAKKVERNIRTAVDRFSGQHDFKKFNEAIRIPNFYLKGDAPSNNELISVIADRLIFELNVAVV